MKIAIMGTAPTKVAAPFADQSWTIWACSPGNMDLPRIDRFYEMHHPDLLATNADVTSGPFREWLGKRITRGESTVAAYPFGIFAGADVYPVERMLEKFGANFFSSSIAYMLAHAISTLDQDTPEREIGVWGVDMASEGEQYSFQREGCLHFLDVARMAGIKVTLPAGSRLLDPSPMYGYGQSHPVYCATVDERNKLERIVGELEKSIASLSEQRRERIGQIEALKFVQARFMAGR